MQLPCKPDFCVGCGNCTSVCSVGAIKLDWDKEGFLKAVVNETCIECGACKTVCPAVNDIEEEKNSDSEFYIVQALNEIRMQSTSGGTFAAIAKEFIKNGGYVCGAVWKGVTNVGHLLINDIKDVSRLQGSKYIQSNLGDIKERIKELLIKGEKVLFSGTSCQVASLKLFLGDIEANNLFTVDFWCHGVSSKKVLEKYLRDIYPKREVVRVGFRNKVFYGWSSSIHVDFADNTSVDLKMDEDLWWQCYLNNVMLGTQCADQCKYTESKADLTLADFWGITEYIDQHNIDDGRGTSVACTNTEKGGFLLNTAMDNYLTCIKTTFDVASKNNVKINPVKVDNGKRKRFFNLLENNRLDDAFSLSMKEQFDVGIVGLWFTGNYGGALTGWALDRIISSLGYSTIFIDFEKSKFLASQSGKVESFIRNNCVISRAYKNSFDIQEVNDLCDTFVVGSDQCWRMWVKGYYDYLLYLDFANSDKRLLSYSTSLESDYIEGTTVERSRIGKYLERFDRISVREKNSVDFLSEFYGVSSTFVLDPILMLNEEQWQAFFKIDETTNLCVENYIGAYFLDINETTAECLETLKSMLGYNYYVLRGTDSTNIFNLNIKNEIKDSSLSEMVAFMKKSSFIITDSYHGCCLAIAFSIPFVAIINERRGGSRFRSLLNEIGLKDKMIPLGGNISDINLKKINWDDVHSRVEKLRNKSLDWLKEALCCKIKERNSIDEQGIKMEILKSCLKNITKESEIAFAYASELRDKIINPRKNRILNYIQEKIPDGAKVAYRGGGYHTDCLNILLKPIFMQKKIDIVGIVDQKELKKWYEYEMFKPSDERMRNIEYLIISSAKYHKEMISEKYVNFTGEVIDIYKLFDGELDEGQAYFEV